MVIPNDVQPPTLKFISLRISTTNKRKGEDDSEDVFAIILNYDSINTLNPHSFTQGISYSQNSRTGKEMKVKTVFIAKIFLSPRSFCGENLWHLILQ